jgi:hypothetical protein
MGGMSAPRFRVIQGGRLSLLPTPRVPLPAPWRQTVELCFATSAMLAWNDAAFLIGIRSKESLTEFERDRLARTWRRVAATSHPYASDDGDAA